MEPNSLTDPVGPTVNYDENESTRFAQVLTDLATKVNSANVAGTNEIVVTLNDHRLTIQVVNRETREVVQQISPPSLFQMYKRIASS
jgi:uncharacterized FlaG/YvyC family protein